MWFPTRNALSRQAARDGLVYESKRCIDHCDLDKLQESFFRFWLEHRIRKDRKLVEFRDFLK